MKTQTYNLMKLYTTEGKVNPGTGIHTLSDEEMLQLVEIEYGQTLQSVIQLFLCICKKYTKERR